ncbi:hypothetical protein [Paenibacillus massiliensis]|uniref:hypothetical protein n=1 Tax=Paenibacillus massiliensis TaxID=225917 RepID=UPI00037DAAC4|nr:hypothetical protein [Paenibacillus massiliensis]
MLKKWPLLFLMGIIVLASAGWTNGVAHAGYYYEYTWDKYKGTELRTFKLTPVPGREGVMERTKSLAAISKSANVYGDFNGFLTGGNTGVAVKSVTDGVYTYSITDSVYHTEPLIVDYASPTNEGHTGWNGTESIQIFMKGSEAAALAEQFYEGTATEGRYHFNTDEVYLIHFWPSTGQSTAIGMTAEALVEEGTATLINRVWVGQVKDRDPAAFPQNGILEDHYYIYKGSEIKKD